MSSSKLSCRICGCEADHHRYIAKETIMGSFERFFYFKCLDCGCLQIESIPKDLGRYYAFPYHAQILELGRLERKGTIPLKQGLGKLVLLSARRAKRARVFLEKLFPGFLCDLGELGIDQESRILDYGCGRGSFLFRLHGWGFKNLLGLDPYVEVQQQLPAKGLVIKKGDYTQLTGIFDLIILNHVIEHLENPLLVLKAMREHLSEAGTIIVSTPLADSYGWRKFGNCWAMWDPPRHLHLFTVKSMAVAAQKSGLKIAKIQYDSGQNNWTTSQLFSLSPESGRISTLSQEELSRHQKKLKKYLKMIDALGDSEMASFWLKIG
ncbi:class I SAM-dependent methyltransferase [Candidatus Methylacidiphilum infernorum]|uniref:Class I SAM-dependent methyltransferase n=1 Tax=Candidatus Methylacidiphilum infernorum TaxID=511746 RepID=A0ABX7PUA2_9BACT|nr:class I SAM-dependent methyltransferase [Candidatus Methylacidiphilum infernorum]QSR86243.1 class I SAM-dependent methyltransferase [Candidatus Methylacidiphilum infernorum]